MFVACVFHPSEFIVVCHDYYFAIVQRLVFSGAEHASCVCLLMLGLHCSVGGQVIETATSSVPSFLPMCRLLMQ